jgi:hypothetical protein
VGAGRASLIHERGAPQPRSESTSSSHASASRYSVGSFSGV